ncbi:hypothetical protein MBAV_002518 [Candidatus Magnetobacterium bavaricum]|uniref:Uncharacterized protein n=1 Tax=Candidatus Magnetobacterium bavaricum TaxID=29290 RepID=A0A0F3GX85_9BACT|nr:hypothetical protein MBAV_002518 [Candidatus Magnetobacterium bavaricum]
MQKRVVFLLLRLGRGGSFKIRGNYLCKPIRGRGDRGNYLRKTFRRRGIFNFHYCPPP